MRKRIGFLKNAIAEVSGYFSKRGEKLVSARLTPEEAEAFNGGPKKKKVAAAPKKVAAETVVPPAAAPEAPVAETKPAATK
jgi:hypothetical protein